MRICDRLKKPLDCGLGETYDWFKANCVEADV